MEFSVSSLPGLGNGFIYIKLCQRVTEKGCEALRRENLAITAVWACGRNLSG